MPRATRDLPEDLPDTFSFAEARARGASERRLRGADLEAPYLGGRAVPFEADDDMDAWEQRRAQHLHLMRA